MYICDLFINILYKILVSGTRFEVNNGLRRFLAGTAYFFFYFFSVLKKVIELKMYYNHSTI